MLKVYSRCFWEVLALHLSYAGMRSVAVISLCYPLSNYTWYVVSVIVDSVINSLPEIILESTVHLMADNTHRWSDVVPPHTALSFAALWDPVEGMVTFSGGRLLDSDVHAPSNVSDVPRDAHDGQSTVLSFDGLTLPLSNSILGIRKRFRVPTVTFAYNALDDTHSVLDPFLRRPAERQLQAPVQQQGQHTTAHFDWSHIRSVGRTIYTFAQAPLERGTFHSTEPDSSGSVDSSPSDDFFEEVPLTAGTFSSAPVLVNFNLVGNFTYKPYVSLVECIYVLRLTCRNQLSR